MDDQTQNRILGLRSDELSGRTPFCPDDQHIAEYFDDALDQSERLALDRHLADCAFCLGRIGALHRLESGQGQRRVPEDLLATVKQLETRALRRSSFAKPAWATAAMAVIALFLILGRGPGTTDLPDSSASNGAATEEPYPQLRNAKPL